MLIRLFLKGTDTLQFIQDSAIIEPSSAINIHVWMTSN